MGGGVVVNELLIIYVQGILCNCLTSCSKNLGQFALYWRGSGWWGGGE